VLVEGTLISLYTLIWTPFDVKVQTSAAIPNVFYSLYAAILLLILVTDLEHRLIPHAIMLPTIAVAVLAAFVNPAWDSPTRALLGGALGLLCGLTLYGGGILFTRLLGRVRGQPIEEVAFGFGDVTLITFIGLIVGAPDILLALIIGILGGGLAAFLLLILRGIVKKEHTLFTAIPYAPFLIFGGTVMLVFGREVLAWYMRGM
jgi:prepilin signal peptidase PulO-like enzyme (type II secretory pathway)